MGPGSEPVDQHGIVRGGCRRGHEPVGDVRGQPVEVGLKLVRFIAEEPEGASDRVLHFGPFAALGPLLRLEFRTAFIIAIKVVMIVMRQGIVLMILLGGVLGRAATFTLRGGRRAPGHLRGVGDHEGVARREAINGLSRQDGRPLGR